MGEGRGGEYWQWDCTSSATLPPVPTLSPYTWQPAVIQARLFWCLFYPPSQCLFLLTTYSILLAKNGTQIVFSISYFCGVLGPREVFAPFMVCHPGHLKGRLVCSSDPIHCHHGAQEMSTEYLLYLWCSVKWWSKKEREAGKESIFGARCWARHFKCHWGITALCSLGSTGPSNNLHHDHKLQNPIKNSRCGSSCCGAAGWRSCVVSAVAWFPSPAWSNWLRIWRCCSCGACWSCGSDSVPAPGTSTCLGDGQERKKKKKMEKEKEKVWS